MILLLGGTSETAPIAEGLANAGHFVLVSNCTDTPLNTGAHAAISVRTGALDEDSLAELIAGKGITAVVDSTHPYAQRISEIAARVCGRLGVHYSRFERPAQERKPAGNVWSVPDHAAAARRACTAGRTVLLTTGSRNLAPYADAAAETGCRLFARVLDCPESMARCRDAGIPPDHVIVGRGPFSVADNEEVIRRHGIDVIVTKDTGTAGGLPEKLAAAENTRCRVVLVVRPTPPAGPIYTSIPALIEAAGGRKHEFGK